MQTPDLLTPAGRAALAPARILLRETQGFLYLPLLAENQVVAAAALDYLEAGLPGVRPFHIAWPLVPLRPLGSDTQTAAALVDEITSPRKQLLQNLDNAIAVQAKGAVLVLDASQSDRHALALASVTYLNQRREALRKHQLRLILLWPAARAEALIGGAPDLWSMRSLAPVVDGAALQAASADRALLVSDLGESPSGPRAGGLNPQRERQWQRWLAQRDLATAQLSVAEAFALIEGLSEQSEWAAVVELGEGILRELSRSGGDSHLSDRAHALDEIAKARARQGDYQGALAPARGAVEILEGLAVENFSAYGANLAGSLSNLSNRLGESGDWAGGLTAIRRAVEIDETLAGENLAVYGAELAGSLNNLSNCLANSGDRAGGLSAIRRAVEIREKLAAENFASYGAGLAGSLNNLSNRLAESGDRAGGLTAIRRSVEMYEKLAAENFAVYGADLAMSLNNLSVELSESGDQEAGLTVIRRAVEILEKLAAENFAVYGADLASGLNNLSNRLAESGDGAGGLTAIRRAVEFYEKLGAANFAAYGAKLAVSLNNLSVRLSESGDRAGALKAIRRAVEIREMLAAENFSAYGAELASSLNNLSNRLAESGDHAGGLASLERAIEIITPFALPGTVHADRLETMLRRRAGLERDRDS